MRSKGRKPAWNPVAFGEIADNVTERVDRPAESGVDRYVGLEHLEPGSLRIQRWGSPTDVFGTKLRFRKGDIVFGRRRAYQRKLAVAHFDGICSAHALVLRARPRVVLPEFLPFFMQSEEFMARAQRISVGSLSPTINWRTLEQEEFVLPPRPEQRRLAATLMASLEVGRSYEDALASLWGVIRSTVTDLEYRLGPDDVGTLGEVVVKIESGKSPRGASRPATLSERGVLKVSAVGDWNFCTDQNKRISEEAFVPGLEVQRGDFLATRANADPAAVGRTCVVEDCRSGLMLSDKTWRLSFIPDLSLPLIGVLAWTKSARFRRHVEQQLGGTEAKNISKSRFLSAPFPTRSADFVHFSRRAETLYRGIRAFNTRLSQWSAVHRSCIAQVFARD